MIKTISAALLGLFILFAPLSQAEDASDKRVEAIWAKTEVPKSFEDLDAYMRANQFKGQVMGSLMFSAVEAGHLTLLPEPAAGEFACVFVSGEKYAMNVFAVAAEEFRAWTAYFNGKLRPQDLLKFYDLAFGPDNQEITEWMGMFIKVFEADCMPEVRRVLRNQQGA